MGGVRELVVVPILVPVATHFNSFTPALCEHARKPWRTGSGGLSNITQKRRMKRAGKWWRPVHRVGADGEGRDVICSGGSSVVDCWEVDNALLTLQGSRQAATASTILAR